MRKAVLPATTHMGRKTPATNKNTRKLSHPFSNTLFQKKIRRRWLQKTCFPHISHNIYFFHQTFYFHQHSFRHTLPLCLWRPPRSLRCALKTSLSPPSSGSEAIRKSTECLSIKDSALARAEESEALTCGCRAPESRPRPITSEAR